MIDLRRILFLFETQVIEDINIFIVCEGST
jgi:hypothetical protein